MNSKISGSFCSLKYLPEAFSGLFETMVSGKILRKSFCLLSFSLIFQVVLHLINELDPIRPNNFLNLKPSFFWGQECKWEGVWALSRNPPVSSFCRGGHQTQRDCNSLNVIWLAGGSAPSKPRSPSPGEGMAPPHFLCGYPNCGDPEGKTKPTLWPLTNGI